MVKTILGDDSFLNSIKNDDCDFLLGCCVTKTSQIPGITQAGIPGLIHLTPTLDCEYLVSGEIFSLDFIPTTQKGVPTPALITRAISKLKPFANILILDLGFEIKPKINNVYNFDIFPSDRIDLNAKVEAKEIFYKGLEFGKNYRSNSKVLILGESTPAGTTTAYATAKALAFNSDNLFSSSFKNSPKTIKEEIVNRAYKISLSKNNIFEKLSIVTDNMIMFYSGFIISASQNYKLLLAGGTQMASVLLVMDKLSKELNLDLNYKNIALGTTKWVYEDKNSDIKEILKQLSFKINAFYSDFSFKNSNIEILKLYDEGEAKEGVGAGGALIYGFLKDLTEDEIIKKIEQSMAR